MIDTESDAPEPDAAESDSIGSEIDDESTIEGESTVKGDESKVEDQPRGKKSERRQLSVSLRSVVLTAVIVAVVGAIATLAWLYVGALHKLDVETRQSEGKAHAEKVALDYAVEAAAMNFQDMDGWKVRLVKGTSPELKEKLTKAAQQMEQILVPLQWNSTARPLAAKVRSVNGGIYVVDSFVSVQTKTMQAPEPLQSTATYSVTIDSSKDWQITDVGGVGDALGK